MDLRDDKLNLLYTHDSEGSREEFLLQRANAHLHVCETLEASQDAREALRINPKSANAYGVLGEVCRASNQTADAAIMFCNAMEYSVPGTMGWANFTSYAWAMSIGSECHTRGWALRSPPGSPVINGDRWKLSRGESWTETPRAQCRT
jgi:hypothetical protein